MDEPHAPRPPLLRLRNILLALAGLAIALFLGALYRAASLRPGVAGRFTADLQKLTEQAQPPGKPDAWTDFADAAARVKAVTDRLDAAKPPQDWPITLAWPPRLDELPPSRRSDPSPEIDAAARRILDQFAAGGVFEALDKVERGERFVRPLPAGTALLNILLPEISPARDAARLCRIRMEFAALEGDLPAFLRACRHALALSDVCKRQTTLIEHLVGAAIQSMTLEVVRTAAFGGRLTPETIREVLALMDRRAGPLDAARGFAGEQLAAHDIVEWTHTDDGSGDGSFIPALALPLISQGSGFASGPPVIVNLTTFLSPSKKQTLQVLDGYYDRWREAAARPLRERQSLPSPEAGLDAISPRYILARAMLPAMGSYLRAADASLADIAGTRALLAVQLHRAAHGDYPASLDGLDPALASVGVAAPWASELRYRRVAAGEDPGFRPYILYWIGLDGVDDGGKPSAKSDRRSPSNAEPGTDFVFTPPLVPPTPVRPFGTGKEP